MAAPKKMWTGDLLDGLEKKVDDGFGRVDQRFDQVDQQFKKVDKRFEKVDERFEKVEGKIESGVKDLDAKFDTKFDGLQKTLFGAAVSVVVTLLVCCATLIGVAVL